MKLLVELKSMYSNGVPNRTYMNVAKWKTTMSGLTIIFEDGKKEIITDYLRVTENI